MTSDTAMPATRRKTRLFYTGMAVAIALTVFTGFSRTYYLKSVFGTPELSALIHLHGAVFTTWILLFCCQTFLVASGNTKTHRQLGIAGAGLAALMVPLGVAAAIYALRTNQTPPGIDPRSFLVFPLFDMMVFPTLVIAGLVFRNRPETHKRLMLLATIGILDAALARVPGIMPYGPPAFLGVQDLFLIALLVYDWRTKGRIERATIWGSLLIFLSQPLRLVVSQTPLWLAFGDWLKG